MRSTQKRNGFDWRQIGEFRLQREIYRQRDKNPQEVHNWNGAPVKPVTIGDKYVLQFEEQEKPKLHPEISFRDVVEYVGKIVQILSELIDIKIDEYPERKYFPFIMESEIRSELEQDTADDICELLSRHFNRDGRVNDGKLTKKQLFAWSRMATEIE